MKRRYQKIEDLSAKLSDWMESNKHQLDEFRRNFEMSYIYHENALEGVVISGPELVNALATMNEEESASSVPVYQEIRTLKQAIDYMKKELDRESPVITLKTVHDLYNILTPVDPDDEEKVRARSEGKCYRKEAQLGHRSYLHEIAAPENISAQMEDFMEALAAPSFKEKHTIDQACHAHWQMMKIFPFTERTGKIARLIANFILVSRGYEPMIIHATDRQRYYDALRASEENLRLILVDAMANSLENAILYFSRACLVPQHRTRGR